MVGSVLHYILDLKHVLQFCTMTLYNNHTLIYQKLTGFQIRVFVFFSVMLEHYWSMCSFDCQIMEKMALSQVSVNRCSGNFIELNAIKLKGVTCVKPIFACSFIAMCLG